MRRALRDLKVLSLRSSASLVSVTLADHRRWDGCLAIAPDPFATRTTANESTFPSHRLIRMSSLRHGRAQREVRFPRGTLDALDMFAICRRWGPKARPVKSSQCDE